MIFSGGYLRTPTEENKIVILNRLRSRDRKMENIESIFSPPSLSSSALHLISSSASLLPPASTFAEVLSATATVPAMATGVAGGMGAAFPMISWCAGSREAVGGTWRWIRLWRGLWAADPATGRFAAAGEPTEVGRAFGRVAKLRQLRGGSCLRAGQRSSGAVAGGW